MNFQELATTRRSYRKFEDKEIDDATLNQILTAALKAPTSKNCTSWEFIVVKDQARREALAKCKPAGAAFVATAPVTIVVLADTTKTDVWIEDCSIAATFIQLAAEDLNIGTCWAQVRLRESNSEGENADQYIHKLLNIPDNYAVECLISLGHKPEQRKPFDDARLQPTKIHNEQF